MNKLIHLLLITIILYFLFFQDIKEPFKKNYFKELISKERTCNNISDMDICITNDDCGVYTSSENKKSNCVLDYFSKIKNKHVPYFSNLIFKNHKNIPYYDLDKGIYSKNNENYATDNKSLFKPIKLSTFDLEDNPKSVIPLTKNLIVNIDKYSSNNKDILEPVVYDITNEINNKFNDYVIDGSDKFEVVLSPTSDKSKNLNISFKYNNSKPYLAEITGIPKEYLNETLFEIKFYAKRGASLLCDKGAGSEICKYKMLVDEDCGGGNDISCGEYSTLNDALEACDKNDECGYVNTTSVGTARSIAPNKNAALNGNIIKNSPNPNNPQVAWCLKRKYKETNSKGNICYKKSQPFFERNDFYGCSGADLEGPGGITAPWNNKKYMCGAFDHLSDAKRACLNDQRCQAVTTWHSGWGGKDYSPKRKDPHPSRKGWPLFQVPSQDPDGVIPIDDGKPQGIWCLKGKNNENDKDVTVNSTQGDRGSTCYLLKR